MVIGKKGVGIIKEYARRDTLMVDVDRPNPRALVHVFTVLREHGLRASWIRYDKTNRGWHIIVRLTNKRNLFPRETVILQMRMGSDMRREGFNSVRAMSGKANHNRRWNMLFEEKI